MGKPGGWISDYNTLRLLTFERCQTKLRNDPYTGAHTVVSGTPAITKPRNDIVSPNLLWAL